MKPFRMSAAVVAALLLTGVVGAALVAAQAAQRPPTAADPSTQLGAGGIEVLQIRPNFYMLAGAGGNIGVQTGADGVVVVDSGSAAEADNVVAAITRLWQQPIRYVINTGPDADHVGGNAAVARAGRSILNLGGLGAGMTNNGAATIVAHERVLSRMSAPTGEASPFSTPTWPTETFFERRRYMYLNGEGIEILHQPSAHTDGDSVVFFRRSDLVMAGDIIDYTRFPVIDVAKGGGIQGEIDALNTLVELAIPSIPLVWRADGTRVIPGHGRVLTQVDVADYRDMVTIIRDRVKALIDQGRTLEQVRAAAPAAGWARRFGADSGPWTTNMFVEAIYRSLTQTGTR